jgi:chemotaxis response regulator CheB
MESAAELHEARVLRARIEMREADLAALPADAPSADRARLAEEIAKEIERLKSDYRRVLARQADEDYSRRRAEWRAQQQAGTRAACRRPGASACA